MRLLIKLPKIVKYLGLLVPFTMNSSYLVHAAGKSSSHPESAGPTLGTPLPVRPVLLLPVGTKAFQLPNGASVNLGADLQSMLNTVVASTPAFATLDPGSAGAQDPCQSHLELRAAVTTFELNVANVGIKVGYNAGGALGPVTGITGKTNVQIGTISMDFSVWECDGTRCVSPVAASANQATAGVSLSADIDFGAVTTSTSFVYNTPIGDILRKIMIKGMNEVSKSSRLNELSWRAQVKEYQPTSGELIFDAGIQSRISPNQTFVIYAPTDSTSTGGCHPYKSVAHVHTLNVDTVSSRAVVDAVLDSRGIQAGDVVMVRPASVKP